MIQKYKRIINKSNKRIHRLQVMVDDNIKSKLDQDISKTESTESSLLYFIISKHYNG